MSRESDLKTRLAGEVAPTRLSARMWLTSLLTSETASHESPEEKKRLMLEVEKVARKTHDAAFAVHELVVASRSEVRKMCLRSNSRL